MIVRCIRSGHRQYILDFSPLVEVMLHSGQFKRKPQGKEIGAIKSSMQREETTLVGLAEAIAHGQTFCPGVLSGGCRNADWTSQQVFALDFDNKENDPLALQHFQSKCKRLGIQPSLIYSTFSSTESAPKFRALFLCQKPITQNERSKEIMNALLEDFSEADQSCKDPGRIFFGGTKILYQDNTAFLSLGDHWPSHEKMDAEKSKANTPAFQALLEVDFLNFIRSTGDYQETDCGNRIEFDPCPLCGHHGDFSYYKNTNSYCCYSASGDTCGSIIDFMMAKEKISEHGAWLKLEKLVGHQIEAAPIYGTSSNSILYGTNGIGDDKTEMGLAKAFSLRYGETLRYTEAWGWVAWNGLWWDIRSGGLCAIQWYQDLANAILADISAAIGKNPGNRQLDADLKWARFIRNRKTCVSVLDLAKPLMSISTEAFDANPYDLNTPGGIVNLRTGDIRPHTPDAYCTNITKVAPNRAPAGKEEWLSFMKWVTSGNKEVMRYLQHIAGMACIGAVMYEGVVFSYGTGANGKSTLWNALQSVLGSYSNTIAPEILMTCKNASREVVGLASVQNKRLVLAAETEEGNRIAANVLKRLSSTDKIAAKRLYKDPFEFKPTHTLVLSTNHLPKIGSNDDGTWRRVIAIPFQAKMDPSKAKSDYANVLVEKAGGYILGWMIRGAKAFLQTSGQTVKNPPKIVRLAIEEYRRSEDWLANFIAECCKADAQAKIRTGELHGIYCRWCSRTGEYQRRVKDFTAALTAKNYEIRKGGHNQSFVMGLKENCGWDTM